MFSYLNVTIASHVARSDDVTAVKVPGSYLLDFDPEDGGSKVFRNVGYPTETLHGVTTERPGLVSHVIFHRTAVVLYTCMKMT
jgi:hypothetical protein